MEWNDSYNIGIEVIDNQHRQILDYINILEEVRKTGDRGKIKEVLEDLIDYTQPSHILLSKKIFWNRCIISICLRIAAFMICLSNA